MNLKVILCIRAQTGSTALLKAVKTFQEEIAGLLIANGAHLDICDEV